MVFGGFLVFDCQHFCGLINGCGVVELVVLFWSLIFRCLFWICHGGGDLESVVGSVQLGP